MGLGGVGCYSNAHDLTLILGWDVVGWGGIFGGKPICGGPLFWDKLLGAAAAARAFRIAAESRAQEFRESYSHEANCFMVEVPSGKLI